jgi:hypothetical protein
MNNTHLTDENLQAYLLREIQDDDIAIHLTACALCRQKLEEYQALMNNIAQIKAEAFAFDVDTLVMNNITLYEKKKSRRQEVAFWMIFIVVLVVIASFSIPFLPKLLAIFNSNSTLSTLLISGTGLAILLFLLADTIRQYKQKEEKLFQNKLQPTL